MQPPRDLLDVITQTQFLQIALLCAVVLFAAKLADARLEAPGGHIDRVLASADRWTTVNTYGFLRLLVGLLFAVLASDSRTMLTPELQASAPCVAELQWMIACTALFPATGVVAGTGILMLYGRSIEKCGLFHMFDYPAFIGVAIYLMWMSFDKAAHQRALVALRIATALTLMVGATEKFGYPQSSFNLLGKYPVLTFGVKDLEFYMVAAGVVEFALAYLLQVGKVASTVGAAILLLLMASAIILFSWIDAVVHGLFLGALLVLTLNNNAMLKSLCGYFGRYWPRHTLAKAGASAVLFIALMLIFVKGYHDANVALTVCSTTPEGIHLHR